MKNYQGPITQENFTETWDYVSNQLSLIEKRKWIRKAVTFVGNITMLFYLLLITYGLLRRLKDAEFLVYLDKSAILADMWKTVGTWLEHPELHWGLQVLIYILPMYVMIAILCGVVFALIWFLYQPKSKYEISGDTMQDSKELYKMARIAEIRAKHAPVATSFACNVIFILTIMIYLTGYLLALLSAGNMEELMRLDMLYMSSTISPYFSNTLIVNVIGLLFLASYTILNSIMGYMLKPIYITRIPETLVADTESYFHACNPEEKSRVEEEEKILAQAREITKRRQEEKNALRNELNYKNPIFKKIKIGVIVVMVVSILGFGVWFMSKVNLSSIMGEMPQGEIGTESGTEINTEIGY